MGLMVFTGQLFASWDQDVANNNAWWRRGARAATSAGGAGGEAARALCRAGDVALRCLRAARPLAHRMSIWTVVGPHFMQVSYNIFQFHTGTSLCCV